MISLEEANYNFKPVHFTCDETLGDHIKEPFPNRSFFWAIVGRPGSGKTSLLINCLTEKNTIGFIIKFLIRLSMFVLSIVENQ